MRWASVRRPAGMAANARVVAARGGSGEHAISPACAFCDRCLEGMPGWALTPAGWAACSECLARGVDDTERFEAALELPGFLPTGEAR